MPRPKNWDGFNSGCVGQEEVAGPSCGFGLQGAGPCGAEAEKSHGGAICYIAEHGNTIAMGWCSWPEQRGSSG